MLEIISKNKTEYKILIPRHPTLTETYAGEQLQKYFKKVANTVIDIVSECDGPVISIGDTALFDSLNINVEEKELNYDGFIIKNVRKNIFIQGANERGKIYGTNDFIERFLGVKFLAPNVNYQPKIDNLILDDINIKEIPEFRYRLFYDGGIFFNKVDEEYECHKRMFNDFSHENEKFGYRHEWTNKVHPCHNIFSYINREKYINEHPDFFASYTNTESCMDDVCYLNGLNEDGTVDESNELSVFKIVLESLKQFILEDKDAKIFPISLNDASKKCLCKRCNRIIEKYGSFSAIYCLFINALSREIEKWLKEEKIDREIILEFYVYSWCTKAPKTVISNGKVEVPSELKLRDNVYIMYCLGFVNHAYSIIDQRQDKESKENLLNWSYFTNNIMIWEYCCNYDIYLWYFPQLLYIKENLKTYKRLSSYVLSLSDYTMYNSWSSLIRSYVITKLFWNVDLDVYKLAEEFIEYYHKDSAEIVKKVFYSFENHYRKKIEDGLAVDRHDGFELKTMNQKDFPKSLFLDNIKLLKDAIKREKESNHTEEDKNVQIERLTQVLLIPEAMYIRIYCDNPYDKEFDGIFNTFFENLKICKQLDDLGADIKSQFREGFSYNYMVNTDRGVINFRKSNLFKRQCVERVIVRKESFEYVSEITHANIDDLKKWVELYKDEVNNVGLLNPS